MNWNKISVGLATAFAFGLGSCATTMTLPVEAIMQGSPERMVGTATGHLDGAGEITLTSTDSTICRGNFVYVTAREGSGTLACSDNRSGAFKFVSTGTRGTGSGMLDGKLMTFTFGKMP